MNGTVLCLGDSRQHLAGRSLLLLRVEVSIGMGHSGKDEAPYPCVGSVPQRAC